MVNFISKKELSLSNEFLKNGYLIQKITDSESLSLVKNLFVKIITKKKEFKNLQDREIFDKTHKYAKKKCEKIFFEEKFFLLAKFSKLSKKFFWAFFALFKSRASARRIILSIHSASLNT